MLTITQLLGDCYPDDYSHRVSLHVLRFRPRGALDRETVERAQGGKGQYTRRYRSVGPTLTNMLKAVKQKQL